MHCLRYLYLKSEINHLILTNDANEITALANTHYDTNEILKIIASAVYRALNLRFMKYYLKTLKAKRNTK